LDSLIAVLLINPTYNGQSETLNILFNSGKINIISNNSIKNALVLWPQQIEDMTEDEIYSSNIIYNSLYPKLKQYVPLFDIVNSIQHKSKLLKYSDQSAFTSDYEGLFRDRDFESTLATREITIMVSLKQTQDLIKAAEEIIAIINKDLKN
jgi:hypothetical protein